jgi:hypothetical protein
MHDTFYVVSPGLGGGVAWSYLGGFPPQGVFVNANKEVNCKKGIYSPNLDKQNKGVSFL